MNLCFHYYWNLVLLFVVVLITFSMPSCSSFSNPNIYSNHTSLWSPSSLHNKINNFTSENLKLEDTSSTTPISLYLSSKQLGPIISNIRHYRSRKSFTRVVPKMKNPISNHQGQQGEGLLTMYHDVLYIQGDQPKNIHYGTEKTKPMNNTKRIRNANNKNKSQQPQLTLNGLGLGTKHKNRNSSRSESSFKKRTKIRNLLHFSNNTTNSAPNQLSLHFHSKSEKHNEQEIQLTHVPSDVPTFEEINESDIYENYDEYLPNHIVTDLLSNISGSENATESNEEDIVTKFLSYVEDTVENCTAGTEYTLGKGVVASYAEDRFRLEAEVAVNRANMLTRLWKYAREVMSNEYLLHANLFSMVEYNDDIFAAGNCYDKSEYKNYTLYCPFAYRLPEGSIRVKDLAVEYKYLSNTSEFFYAARNSAERVIKNFNQFTRGYNSYTYNESAHTEVTEEIILNVTYEDGKWSAPYFDCGGGNIWMMTYTVPFFDYRNQTYFFKGTSGIDIDLRRVDIDQCPLPSNSTEENIFAASDKCKKTTKCHAIKGLGFRRGSYRCHCKDGYFFPNISSPSKYFNGSLIEEEYEKKLQGKISKYDELEAFECLLCPDGCDTCIDDRPCVVSLNWLMRSVILILQIVIILMLPIVGLFTWKYSEVKVIRAASPVLLRFIVLGAFFIYCTILVTYPSSSIITCTLRVWCREIGFSLAYGALMLKTWRISVIFRVRSAKVVKITDLDLMKRLGVIVGIFVALLVIRTLVAPPTSIVSLTGGNLKTWLCKTDWWDYSFSIMELLLLVWGIILCIVVRKAPSEFNESKFISLAIYNEFLLSLFLNISMLFLQSPANPDLLYIIFFCHVQLTMTLLLCLIFGSKAYLVFRGNGKGRGSDESRLPTSKFKSKARSRTQQQQHHHSENSNSISGGTGTGGGDRGGSALNSIASTVPHIANQSPYNLKIPNDIHEDFRSLYYQLEELKERNLQLGNHSLVCKIQAMLDAADNIFKNPNESSSSGTPLAAKLYSLLSPPSPVKLCNNPSSSQKHEIQGNSENRNGASKRKTSLYPKVFVQQNQEMKFTKPMIKDEDELKYINSVGTDDDKSEFCKLSALIPLDRAILSTFKCHTNDDEGENTTTTIESHPIINYPTQNLTGNEPGESEVGASASVKNPKQPTGKKSSSGTKMILDLDDKSRFTEEIAV